MLKSAVLSCICKIRASVRYSRSGYRKWIRQIYRNFFNSKDYSVHQKIYSYKKGFLPETVYGCGITDDNYFNFISQRDYLQIIPGTKKTNAWMKNIIVSRRALEVLGDYYPKGTIYCKKANGTMHLFLLPSYDEILEDRILEETLTAPVLTFLDIKSGKMKTVSNNPKCKNTADIIRDEQISNRTIVYNGDLLHEEAFLLYAYKEHHRDACIGSIFKRKLGADGTYVFKKRIDEFGEEDAVIAKQMDVIKSDIQEFFSNKNAVPIAGFEFKVIDNKLCLIRILRKPPYPNNCLFNEHFSSYLRGIAIKRILAYRVRRRTKIMRVLSHVHLNFREFLLVGKGFTPKNAKKWILKKYVDKRLMCGESTFKKNWAYRHGFTLEHVKKLKIDKVNYKNFISEKEFLQAMPLNLKYQKWLGNTTNYYYMFKPFSKHFPEFYYHVIRRDGKQVFIPLGNVKADEDVYDKILDAIEEKGNIQIINTRGNVINDFSYNDGHFFRDNNEVDRPYILRNIKKIKGEVLIVHNRGFEADSASSFELQLFVYNETGNNPKIGSGFVTVKDYTGNLYKKSVDIISGEYFETDKNKKSVSQWRAITSFVDELCKFIPQIKFFELDILANETGFIVSKMKNYPEYDEMFPMLPDMMRFLRSVRNEKDEFYRKPINRIRRMYDVLKRRIRKIFAATFYPPGLIPYISVTWIRDILHDFLTNKECTFKKKIWAYQHGFLSYRLDQYGVTPENWKNYISDFEYKWLRHINPPYKVWLEDKLSVKYICQEFKAHFPEYYFHVICKNGEKNVIPLIDCPKEYKTEFESIIKLIKDKGSVALKPDEGSHGDGFYRCDYADGKFYLNYKEATEEQVIEVLSGAGGYIVTEYIKMHSKLKEIYSGSVNTIRMIVFKKDGKHPKIGNAYLRIGTASTGAIDNMSAGGMFAAIDVDTGEYGNSKIFIDGDIHDCPNHPDTGVLISGKIPNWERTKSLVLEIAEAINELEYFGFDLAVTEDGIKIPEINRSPDYPKIEKFTSATIDYLLYKLENKKKKFMRNGALKKTLIHLPDREK